LRDPSFSSASFLLRDCCRRGHAAIPGSGPAVVVAFADTPYLVMGTPNALAIDTNSAFWDVGAERGRYCPILKYPFAPPSSSTGRLCDVCAAGLPTSDIVMMRVLSRRLLALSCCMKLAM